MKTWDDIRFSCKSYTCIYKSIVFRQAQPVSMQNYCKEIRSNYILPHCCSIRSNRTMFDSKINKTGMMTTAKGKALYHITHIPFITIKTVKYLFNSLPAVKISLSQQNKTVSQISVHLVFALTISGFMMNLLLRYSVILSTASTRPFFVTAAKY